MRSRSESAYGVKRFMPTDHDRPFRLNEIDVLRVPRGWLQVKFVQRRAAAEREGLMQEGLGEYFDQRPADDEILFDLEVLNPRSLGTPLRDVVAWDHSSGCTCALT